AVFADEAAKHNIGLNRADLMPSLDVKAGAGYQWGQPIPMTGDYDGKYWQVGATLTVPLYQGGGEYSRLREAKQLANVARITLEQTRRDLIKLTTQAWETWQSSKASIVSIKAQIKASKMALDGVIREANVGSRTVLDVLDAEQEHLNYQVNLVRAERDATAAALQLLSAVGKMTAEELKLNVALYNPQDYYKKVNNKWIGGGI
ncbi:MAG: TolC family protein, partial [Alphaproteobacteria bacterium]|nr:TolC family protein [Alphaproteobacteria bacterium]